jgi:hypothetical protein
MSRPGCSSCQRTLVHRDTWLTKATDERRRLARTHAIAEYQSGMCGSCYRRERREWELVYRGGWWRDRHGILRPVEGRAS